jgi:hypothetical protein
MTTEAGVAEHAGGDPSRSHAADQGNANHAPPPGAPPPALVSASPNVNNVGGQAGAGQPPAQQALSPIGNGGAPGQLAPGAQMSGQFNSMLPHGTTGAAGMAFGDPTAAANAFHAQQLALMQANAGNNQSFGNPVYTGPAMPAPVPFGQATPAFAAANGHFGQNFQVSAAGPSGHAQGAQTVASLSLRNAQQQPVFQPVAGAELNYAAPPLVRVQAPLLRCDTVTVRYPVSNGTLVGVTRCAYRLSPGLANTSPCSSSGSLPDYACPSVGSHVC